MATDNTDDNLNLLGRAVPLSRKLELVQCELSRRYNLIDNVSVAVYDAQTDLLKTFMVLNDDSLVPQHYQSKLSNVPSLQELRDLGTVRVIDDLQHYGDTNHEHTRQLRSAGYRSSYTVPMFARGEFFGFIFYDSHEAAYFRPEVLIHLNPFALLLTLVIIDELSAIRTLKAATLTMRHVVDRRDGETGAHLVRMASYCRLIARAIAATHNLDDEYIEHLFLFAPMHDIGKIAIPDSILLKPGPLTEEEFEIMRDHSRKGLELVDLMLQEFGFSSFTHTEVLRNLVFSHHENFDGHGYPQGLKGEAIPIEARITTTADMLDALTSRRPYKPAWPLHEAFEELRRQAGHKLDPACVEALISNSEEVAEIQLQFAENTFG